MVADSIMESVVSSRSHTIAQSRLQYRYINSTAASNYIHGHLGGDGIAGIVLLAIAIIFWVIFVCACFHVRCLLKEDENREQHIDAAKDMEEA